eukprot:1708099-Prymnesium_polylepis.1
MQRAVGWGVSVPAGPGPEPRGAPLLSGGLFCKPLRIECDNSKPRSRPFRLASDTKRETRGTVIKLHSATLRVTANQYWPSVSAE